MKKLFLLLALLPINAMALDFELSGGITKYKRAQNGTWYQEAFPYELDLKSAAWSAGVSHKFVGYPRVRTEFVNLGMASADAYAVPNDYNYNFNDNTCNTRCLPIAHYMSKGDVRGVAFTVAPEWKFGSYTAFVEGGVYVFRPRYWALVTEIIWGDSNGDYAEGARRDQTTVRHKANIQSSWVIGAGVRYKNVDFSLRIYDVGANDDDVPAVYRGASTAFVRVIF